MNWKGTRDGKVNCVFTLNGERAVRNDCGIICQLPKIMRYSGQCERYEQELEEAKANQELIADAFDTIQICDRLPSELLAFKEYTHKRLDDMNIDKEPAGEHGMAGCRIGDRMDIVERMLFEQDDRNKLLLLRHDEAVRLLRLCVSQLSLHYQAKTIDGPVPHSVPLAWSNSFLDHGDRWSSDESKETLKNVTL